MLQKNILATIAYYDAQGFSLTTFEAWRHLLDLSRTRKKTTLHEVRSGLETLQSQGWISCRGGFWFLKGQETLAAKRIIRQRISQRKIRSLKKWATFIAMVPFVEGVFITGTLAMQRADNSSDWDVLIVTKKKRIWLARFLLTSVLYIFKKWRHKEKTKDRFCLNHFISEDGLILAEQNEFTAKEIAFCLPILGKDCYRRYLQLNEYWVQSYTPNFMKEAVTSNQLLLTVPPVIKKTKDLLEKILQTGNAAERLNRYIKKIMIRKIDNNPLTHVKGADIRYNDQALVFLPYPQREKIILQTMQKLTNSRQ